MAANSQAVLIALKSSSSNTISYITETTNITNVATITAMAGIQAGDLLFLFDYVGNTGGDALVTPTGFTSVGNVSALGNRTNISYKKAAGTESSTTITGMGGSDLYTRKQLLQFRLSTPATTITSASFAGQITDSAPTNQTITSSGGTPPLVVLAAFACENNVSSPAMAGSTSVAGGDMITQVNYIIYNSSPANATASLADGGLKNALTSCYIQMA